MEKLPRAVVWCSYLLLSLLCVKVAAFLARFVKRERETHVLEKEYAALLSYRADLLHHYYRAVEDKSAAVVEEFKPKIVKVTKEIDYLRNEFAASFKPKTA